MINSTIDLPGVIRSLRKSLRLTQVELAEKLDITPTSVHRYESGTSNPGMGILRDLFELASQDSSSSPERESLEAVLSNRLRRKAYKRKSPMHLLGPRPFLDVNVLASLSAAEHDFLEATLALLRSGDENTRRVLQAVLKPWLKDMLPPSPPPNE